jgi:hypothetical protein
MLAVVSCEGRKTRGDGKVQDHNCEIRYLCNLLWASYHVHVRLKCMFSIVFLRLGIALDQQAWCKTNAHMRRNQDSSPLDYNPVPSSMLFVIPMLDFILFHHAVVLRNADAKDSRLNLECKRAKVSCPPHCNRSTHRFVLRSNETAMCLLIV